MTTRLTKESRAKFVQAIYAASDLPQREKELVTELKQASRRFLKEAVPAEFVQAIEGLPAGWFDGQIAIRMPQTDVEAFMSPDSYYSTVSITFDDPVSVPANFDVSSAAGAVKVWAAEHHSPKVAQWRADKENLLLHARSLVASYRTVEALLKDAPEMKAYIPKAAVVYLPAVSTSMAIASFMQRGVALQEA